MQEAAFEKYIQDRYEKEVSWYDTQAIRNKCWYERLGLGVLIFSALTPAFIAFSFWDKTPPFCKFLSVATSIFVAIFAGALKFFRFQENWATYRTTCETLRKEIHLCRAKVDAYANAEDKESLFVERVESLISRENTLWLTSSQGKGASVCKSETDLKGTHLK